MLAQKQSTSVTHATFVIERNLQASPERVFAAFRDPEKKRQWFAQGNSHTIDAFESDFRVGGTEQLKGRMNEKTPFPGTSFANHTTYQDIVANQRIVFAYTMSIGERRISASLGTFDLLPNGAGTTLVFTDQGAYFEGSDGAQMREEGWRKHVEKLANEISRW